MSRISCAPKSPGAAETCICNIGYGELIFEVTPILTPNKHRNNGENYLHLTSKTTYINYIYVLFSISCNTQPPNIYSSKKTGNILSIRSTGNSSRNPIRTIKVSGIFDGTCFLHNLHSVGIIKNRGFQKLLHPCQFLHIWPITLNCCFSLLMEKKYCQTSFPNDGWFFSEK